MSSEQYCVVQDIIVSAHLESLPSQIHCDTPLGLKTRSF